MLSNKVAVGLIGVVALGGAAGAGAYLATRHPQAPAAASVAAPSTTPTASGAVEATEAVMDDKDAGAAVPGHEAAASTPNPGPATPAHTGRVTSAAHREAPAAARTSGREAPAAHPAVQPQPVRPGQPVADRGASPAPVAPRTEPVPAIGRTAPPSVDTVAELPPEPQYLEVTVPAESVVGLEIETSISSETARVEDRVEARVTRDVRAEGRVAIPAGSRVVGAVSMVERGGKMKDQARLGVRFHTVILADGTELPLQTETVYRVGEAPGNASAAKVGGGAIGGAILGAILGGGKGAAIGGAIGAAGGTAAVMASERRPATLSAGSPITVKVLSPVTVTVERE